MALKRRMEKKKTIIIIIIIIIEELVHASTHLNRRLWDSDPLPLALVLSWVTTKEDHRLLRIAYGHAI